ncbi:MAG: hypothetical protein SNJ71_01150 [Bacteroidales bacterium]
MKIHYIHLLSIFISLISYSQTFNNHWIRTNQKYFRIGIVKEGIYRLNFTQLSSAGVPMGDFDPRNLQLFHNGKEQPIYVAGEQDGIFHSTDYIEFYARNNDGWLDSALYITPKHHLNPDYSLYNDTAVYYLTWNTSLTNARYKTYDNTNFDSYIPLSYCIGVSRINYTTRYNAAEAGTYLTTSEGWTGEIIGMEKSFSDKILIPNFVNSSFKSFAEMKYI